MPTDNPLGKPGIVKHTGLFLRSKECITRYPSRRLGVDMVNSLPSAVAHTPLDPSPDPYHESVLLSQSIEPLLYGRCHVPFTNGCSVVTSRLYLANFVL